MEELASIQSVNHRSLLLASLLLGVPVPGVSQMLRREPPHLGSAGLSAVDPCQEAGPEIVGRTQGYSRGMSSGRCFVAISPIDMPDLVYRSHVFFNDGMLMVFNSYGPGEDTRKYTSARVFYFFPRIGPIGVRLEPAATLLPVTMADGGEARFAAPTGQLASMERGEVTVSGRLEPEDRGGVEFPRYQGVLLDCGFRMGELPTGLPNGESVFRNAHGQVCAVKNRELFDYAGGEPSFKFTDSALSAWLKTRCPLFSVPF